MATGNEKSGIGSASRRTERLVALFVVAFLLFNYPLLSLFADDALIFGLPVFTVYLFTAWGVVIALLGWILRRR